LPQTECLYGALGASYYHFIYFCELQTRYTRHDIKRFRTKYIYMYIYMYVYKYYKLNLIIHCTGVSNIFFLYILASVKHTGLHAVIPSRGYKNLVLKCHVVYGVRIKQIYIFFYAKFNKRIITRYSA